MRVWRLQAIAFVPEYVTSYKDVGDNKRLQKSGVKANTASKIPDDIQLLRDLSDQGLLITTPPQDYDDSYIIQYAMNHGGFIVSNDRFRDHKRKESSKVRNWLKTHLISFTFILDEFMPNPDFVFPGILNFDHAYRSRNRSFFFKKYFR